MKSCSSIDLHGCTVPEALSQFTDYYNDCVRNGRKEFIEVIHGYGSTGEGGGAIKAALQRLLQSNAACLETWISGDAIGNPGITKVYPKKLLLTNLTNQSLLLGKRYCASLIRQKEGIKSSQSSAAGLEKEFSKMK